MSVEMNGIRGIKPTRMLRAQDLAIDVAGSDVLIVSRINMTYQVDLAYMIQYLTSLVTKDDLGLGDVDNTRDKDKPLSLAVIAALSQKATLVNGIIPSSNLPGYMDATVEVDNFASLPMPGGANQIYITRNTNKTYRWTGTTYVLINPTLALGYTAGTAFPGDKGQQAYAHTLRMDNPHDVRASDLGLGDVDNTSDLNKPLTSAMTTALSVKADLVNGTVPTSQLPGFVDDVLEVLEMSDLPAQGVRGKIYVVLADNTLHTWSGTDYRAVTPTVNLGTNSGDAYPGERGLADRQDIVSIQNTLSGGLNNHVTNYDNPHAVTADQVGLGDVDNTADLDKPISTATQTALDEKLTLSNGIIPTRYLPSYVDDVIEVSNIVTAPDGETGKVYIDTGNNKTYRWGGSSYIEISKSLVIGTTAGTAMDGARHEDFVNIADIVNVLGPANLASDSKVVSEKTLAALVEASRSWYKFTSKLLFPGVGEEGYFYLEERTGDLYGWSNSKFAYYPIAKDEHDTGIHATSAPYYTLANSTIRRDSEGEYTWFDVNGITNRYTEAGGAEATMPDIPAGWLYERRGTSELNRTNFFNGTAQMGSTSADGFELFSLKVDTINQITCANGKDYALVNGARKIANVTGANPAVLFDIPAGGAINGNMYQVSSTKIAVQSGSDTLIWTMDTNTWETVVADGSYKPSGTSLPILSTIGTTGGVWGMAYPLAMEGPAGDGTDDYIVWKRPDALDSIGPEVYDRVEGEGRKTVTFYGPYYVKFGNIGVRTEVRSIGGRNDPQIQSNGISDNGVPYAELSNSHNPTGKMSWFIAFTDGSMSEVVIPSTLNLSHDKLVAYPASYDMNSSGFLSGSHYSVNGSVKAVP